MFKDGFMWGVATAAYQIEGAAKEDGRTPSVWDTFCRVEGKTANGDNGDVACDHYHRYKEDVKLLAELGVKTYRFSISWTRILPQGTGKINQKGIDFYNNLIDELLKYGIIPLVTLFHWDYPQILEDKGGWSNPESPYWFEEYASVVGQSFGDRVKYFITFNEPQCFIGSGHKSGGHAPGKKVSMEELVVIAHHVMMAHGLAVKALRKTVTDSKIGYAPTTGAAVPATDSEEDIEAARKKYFDVLVQDMEKMWNVAWLSDPVMLGRYPEETEAFKEFGKFLPKTYKEDLKIICQPLDFYGQNIYTGNRYKATDENEHGYERLPFPEDAEKTSMGWNLLPESLYWAPKFLYERYKKPIMITENGSPADDFISGDGKIHDSARIELLDKYLKQYERAEKDGVELLGYNLWSFMDNFEWTNGYNIRYGIVYVDYKNQKRTPKDSFYWYKNLIAKD